VRLGFVCLLCVGCGDVWWGLGVYVFVTSFVGCGIAVWWMRVIWGCECCAYGCVFVVDVRWSLLI